MLVATVRKKAGAPLAHPVPAISAPPTRRTPSRCLRMLSWRCRHGAAVMWRCCRQGATCNCRGCGAAAVTALAGPRAWRALLAWAPSARTTLLLPVSRRCCRRRCRRRPHPRGATAATVGGRAAPLLLLRNCERKEGLLQRVVLLLLEHNTSKKGGYSNREGDTFRRPCASFWTKHLWRPQLLA